MVLPRRLHAGPGARAPSAVERRPAAAGEGRRAHRAAGRQRAARHLHAEVRAHGPSLPVEGASRQSAARGSATVRGRNLAPREARRPANLPGALYVRFRAFWVIRRVLPFRAVTRLALELGLGLHWTRNETEVRRRRLQNKALPPARSACRCGSLLWETPVSRFPQRAPLSH